MKFKNCWARGYTLVEILIVLFIISIVSSVAMLSISHNENRELESFANELVQLVTLAEEQAMLKPSVLGLLIDDESLRFAAYQAQDENKNKNKKNNRWVLLHDKILGEKIIPREMKVSLAFDDNSTERDSDELPKIPQIIISTNGDLTPFMIYVGKKGKKPRYVIRGDADGNITNQILS